MNFESDIQHGVYLKFGPLPQPLTWDIEFSRWGCWPNAISWQDHMAAQENAKEKFSVVENLENVYEAIKDVTETAENVIDLIAEEVRKVPRFMKCKKR